MKGFAILHLQREQELPGFDQELPGACPIPRTKGGFEPFGSGIATVQDVKQPVCYLLKKYLN